MRIPLIDPLWTRLYGPYGVRDVAGDLRRLAVEWDKDVADVLFWERLHHQETLYPVTYAALPWLREIAREQLGTRRDVLIFLSWIVYCATSQEVSDDEQYVGLSTDPKRHHFEWLAKEHWLTETDMRVLRQLADWMGTEVPGIVQDCLAELAREADRMTVSNLAWAPLTFWKASGAARALSMFVEGEEIDYICDEMDLTETDFVGLHRLAVTVPGQTWLRDLAFLLDGRELRQEQDELPLE